MSIIQTKLTEYTDAKDTSLYPSEYIYGDKKRNFFYQNENY